MNNDQIFCFKFRSLRFGEVFVFETTENRARTALEKFYGTETVFLFIDKSANTKGLFVKPNGNNTSWRNEFIENTFAE